MNEPPTIMDLSCKHKVKCAGGGGGRGRGGNKRYDEALLTFFIKTTMRDTVQTLYIQMNGRKSLYDSTGTASFFLNYDSA